MSAIAFADLLASKDSALVSEESFEHAINSFHSAFLTNKETLGPRAKLRFFADCCYIQCDKMADMLTFFQTVRNTLFTEQLYFKAAIGAGNLDDVEVSEAIPDVSKYPGTKDVNGTVFGAGVVGIYLDTERFKGVGIFVSDKANSMLIDELDSPDANQLTASSFYFPDDRAIHINKYRDISLSPSEIDGQDEYMKRVMSSFEEAKIIKKKYSRYYYPILMLWLNSVPVSPDDIETDDAGNFRISRANYLLTYFMSGGPFAPKFDDIPQFSSVYLKILDNYIAAKTPDEILEYLIFRLPRRRRIMKELHDVDPSIMSPSAKRRLSKLMAKMET